MVLDHAHEVAARPLWFSRVLYPSRLFRHRDHDRTTLLLRPDTQRDPCVLFQAWALHCLLAAWKGPAGREEERRWKRRAVLVLQHEEIVFLLHIAVEPFDVLPLGLVRHF
jgi:hypothetical protein